ncbi:hypothetical protein Syun_016787 [Stephania yunnanensis]|uniref:Uncharacterized protein n=1 Tax=Stephania yunnanensis TaxID=152371 RepID=A0AAP0P4A4_9MAGN
MCLIGLDGWFIHYDKPTLTFSIYSSDLLYYKFMLVIDCGNEIKEGSWNSRRSRVKEDGCKFFKWIDPKPTHHKKISKPIIKITHESLQGATRCNQIIPILGVNFMLVGLVFVYVFLVGRSFRFSTFFFE